MRLIIWTCSNRWGNKISLRSPFYRVPRADMRGAARSWVASKLSVGLFHIGLGLVVAQLFLFRRWWVQASLGRGSRVSKTLNFAVAVIVSALSRDASWPSPCAAMLHCPYASCGRIGCLRDDAITMVGSPLSCLSASASATGGLQLALTNLASRSYATNLVWASWGGFAPPTFR